MNPQAWIKVCGALDQLSELTGPAREKFLEELRAVDPFVCQEVESLSAQATLSVQLESPPTELLAQLQPTAALSPPPELPKQLGGYRIVSILGAGGMGVVYEAEDPTLQRRVALKVVKQEVAVLPDARARFLREARAAAALQHDHVLPIYHVGEEAGVLFLVMPLLRGETLEDRLRREPGLPLAQILRIGREIAEGLAAAHACGLIHRDIKPANLWLEAGKDRVKIMDFGLARATGADGNLTQTGMIFGTPAYMAPEQGRGDEVDGRADLFSLGCVLYRLCTGTVPFQKKDALSMLVAAASEPVIPPSKRNRAIPESVSDLILKLLAKSPDDRLQSAQEMVEHLATLERTAVHPTTANASLATVPRPRYRAQRSRLRRVAIGGAITALLASLAAYLFFRSSPGSGLGGILAIAPRIAETGKLVFKDDFDTEAPKPVFPAKSLNFENVNGVGRLSTPTKDVLGVLYLQHRAKNFVAECEFEIPSQQEDNGCGFFFRAQSQGVQPFSTYLLLVHPMEKKATFGCYQNSLYTLWTEYPCDERIAFGRFNRLRLEALGAEFRVFINGAFACRIEDSTIAAEGLIGLSAFSAAKGDYTVNFKNLRVFQLDAPYTEPIAKQTEAVAPLPAKIGDLAFQDDFNSATPLPTFLANALSLANEGGKGRYTTKMVGVSAANYLIHTLKDFIAEVEIETKAGGSLIGYGLAFRGRYGVGQGRPSYRVVQLYPKEQKIWLGWMQETSWNYWIDHPCPSKLIFVDRPNVVRLEAKDDRFRVFINGSFVWQLVDARSKEAGLIGLSANAAPGTEVKFSKLRVYHYAKEGKSD